MSELTVKVLGSVAPYCKGNKNCSGYLIEYNNNKYLFDCGNGITRLMNFPDDLNNLSIFISHLHPDHYGDLSAIIQAALVYKRLGYITDNINIYIPNKDKKIVDIIFKESKIEKVLTQNTLDFDYIDYFKNEYPVNIKGYDLLDIKTNDLTIKNLLVPHQVASYAFRIDTRVGSVVYSSDTGSNNNLREFAKNSNLFICESTFLKGQIKPSDNHLYAYEAALIARDACVNNLLLTHFWPEIDRNLYLTEAKEIFSNTDVALEGKILRLSKYGCSN